MKISKIIILFIFAIGAFWVWKFYFNPVETVRIGYFIGGRVNIIYRAYVNNYFDKEGINVKLYTKFLKDEKIFEVPKDEKEKADLAKGKFFGKMSGIEIVDKIMKGEFDGGTIGESSFVFSISKGLPVVAVALLGYDAVPGKAIIIRSDVKINSPEDFKGRRLLSRRAGPGDAMFLGEFLKSINLVPGKDVTVIDQVDEDDSEKWLEEKKVDGGFYHLMQVRKLVEAGTAYVYRPMNWMDSSLSHAVLVFHKDYVENHRDKVQKFVNAYVKRIAYEKNLPQEKRDRSWIPELMIEGEFQGMRIPTYDLPPRVRVDLLEEIQDLLLEYGEIKKKVDINAFVDNSFVKRAHRM